MVGKLAVAPEFEKYVESRAGFQIGCLEEPRTTPEGIVYRFSINGFPAEIITGLEGNFERIAYEGHLPIIPRWVGLLANLGVQVDESPKISFFRKRLEAYRIRGQHNWIRLDRYEECVDFP